ncbi:hypothetical protein C8A01DRAFT_37989 [Parachaetomium inaequale]|uniref:Uncharacterized protein n=1 Tax=Parachaetomium inaequale TaxID=2588326 RepID=A0AAN6SQ64_9PEZI|nr:hypothetical protein C8A01DRAFT_37989 [Parachaetomium inaequale]
MVDLSSISGPTPEQALREYRFYRDQKLPLYHNQFDGQPGLPPKDTTRLVEGDLIPVTNHPGQQLAKRCSDLHDQFLASATIDNNNDGADNNGADNDRANTHGGVNSEAITNNGAIINNDNSAGGSKEPEPSPPANPALANNNNNNPRKTLHIPLQDYLEFTALFHTLATPQTPTAQHQDLTAHHAHLVQTTNRLQHQATLLAEHETALTQRETALAQREAAAALLYDDALLARQLSDVWREGFERGRRQAHSPSHSASAAAASASAWSASTIIRGSQAIIPSFLPNAAAAAGVPAVVHTARESHAPIPIPIPAPVSAFSISLLEAILTRVREVKSKVGAELDQLEREVEALVSRIRVPSDPSSGKGNGKMNTMGSVMGVGAVTGYQHNNSGQGQGRPSGGGRQAGVADMGGGEGSGMAVEDSQRRPVVDKGKGRMAAAARGQDGDVEMTGDVVAAPKGKGQMAAPRALVRVNQAGADFTAAQGQDDVDMEAWLNMAELAESDLGEA